MHIAPPPKLLSLLCRLHICNCSPIEEYCTNQVIVETGIEHKFFWNVLKHFLVTVKFCWGGGGWGSLSRLFRYYASYLVLITDCAHLFLKVTYPVLMYMLILLQDFIQLSFYSEPDGPTVGNGTFKSSILVPGYFLFKCSLLYY